MPKEGRLHRNSQKRFYGDEYIYYIVSKTYKNIPYFKEAIFCDLFIEELKLAKELKKFKLFGFSIIYDHVNLLLKPGKEYNISQVMQSIKKEFSRDVNTIIDSISTKQNEGDIPECRLHFASRIHAQKQFSIRYNKSFDIPKLSLYRNKLVDKYRLNINELFHFKWQKSFHDHVIRNEKDYLSHWRYTVYNHIKHGLPEDWPYTSESYEDMIDYNEI